MQLQDLSCCTNVNEGKDTAWEARARTCSCFSVTAMHALLRIDIAPVPQHRSRVQDSCFTD